MMKYTRLFFSCLLITAVFSVIASPEPDLPFKQAVSIKYPLPASLKGSILKKTVTDYNDIVYVLADKGLYRVSDKELVRDLRYTPLAQKIPVDISIQEGSGHLYYLYEDKALTNGYAGVPYVSLPKGRYTMMAVSGDGSLLLAGKEFVGLAQGNRIRNIALPAEKIQSVYVHQGVFYALCSGGIYQLSGDKLVIVHKGRGLKAVAFRNDEIILGTAEGYYGVGKTGGDSTFSLQTKLPFTNIDQLSVVNGKVWAGAQTGAFMRETDGKSRYFASQRWLNEDKVTGMTADSKGNIFLLTPTGLNKIAFLSETLSGKATLFQDNIRQRHIRYGFIANVTLDKPGDLASARMTDTDNDGLWTAFYLGSQAFRYSVTHEKEAKRYAWEAFEAFERLLSVNHLKGFPARTFERKGFKYSDPDRWHDSKDPEWEWKGTTSSDEFVAYIWVASVLNDMIAETEGEKKRVADFIDKILMHIIDNNYYLIDADGKPTLWGRWNPEYINSFPESVDDRKLGSTTIIAGLQLGYRLTGKKIYETEAFRLINDFGYLKNITIRANVIQATKGIVHKGVDLGDGGWNHSDDEMAFLTYWVLYRNAFNADLQKQYAEVINDYWQIEKPEKNAVWNLITLGTSGNFDQASTLWHLREFPTDLIRWNVKNSHRKDLVRLPPNFRNQTIEELLPPGEMPMHRHNANPFDLDDGENGQTELAGDEYLLPYWMARYLKVIE